MAAVSQDAANAAARRFTAAHEALRADRSVQFDLRAVTPPPKPPGWIHTVGEWISWALRPIGRAFGWLFSRIPDAPYARMLFWGALAIIAGLLIWLIVERVRSGAWRWRRKSKLVLPTDEMNEWLPEGRPARAWLREADALAAEGHFAEAVHHLLLRSVEDISHRRPQLVRPALTSRDIVAAAGLPAAVRSIFTDIARTVERSLFGGRAVDEHDWQQARTAYADLASAGTWR